MAVWQAYETLDKSKVRGSGHRVSTDLVSRVHYTLDEAKQLFGDVLDTLLDEVTAALTA